MSETCICLVDTFLFSRILHCTWAHTGVTEKWQKKQAGVRGGPFSARWAESADGECKRRNSSSHRSHPTGGGGEQRRANEVRVCRNVGTDTNSCETTMVSSRHSRAVKLWANKDTRLALPPRAVVPETAPQHAPGLSPHLWNSPITSKTSSSSELESPVSRLHIHSKGSHAYTRPHGTESGVPDPRGPQGYSNLSGFGKAPASPRQIPTTGAMSQWPCSSKEAENNL